MDYLNSVTALSQEFSVEISETDYTKLTSLNDCIEYLSAAGAVQRPWHLSSALTWRERTSDHLRLP